MPNLRRSEDTQAHPVAWDQASPAIVEPEVGDRRTPPAAERVFAALAMPWDRQILALDAASEELRVALRDVERLEQIDEQLLRVRNNTKLARLDLADLDKRRQTAISRAVTEADEGPRMLRKRRVEEARTEAAQWYDKKIERTRRLATTRLHTAEREERRLLDEREALVAHPLVGNADAVGVLRELAAAIAATLTRDRAARGEALGDWARLRGTDERILAHLRKRPNSVVLPGQAFGEGPIHLIADNRLALIELRRGRDGVRTEEVDGDLRLVQVLPQADEPLGLTDGTTQHLTRAARTVEGAIGLTPAKIVCVSAWVGEPSHTADLILCGPTSLADVLQELDETPVTRDQLKQAARALAMLPIPEPEAEPVATLDHLTALQPEDVPDGVPFVRDLIVFAHERRHEAY